MGEESEDKVLLKVQGPAEAAEVPVEDLPHLLLEVILLADVQAP
eukprot:CAMPEP_0113992936 /NCGR_PEP_ID=MMETSP0328-20130328/9871_1 /TAXON_ID=39455 /ORGANISM="Alexandrium minutum" /LENGTH=43 /assembly_acc=CAM_ASM_000350